MTSTRTDNTIRHAAHFLLSGTVQGRGVRPSVARLATELDLTGHVRNTSGGVAIMAIATQAEQLCQFESGLKTLLPDAAVFRQECSADDAASENLTGFRIVSSFAEGPLKTVVPRDIVTCKSCRSEVQSSDNRRGGFSFNSCTDCGPRYSVINGMPWERDDSTMQAFELCHDCRREFTSTSNRRLHAQTIACRKCGPVLVASHAHNNDRLLDEAAIEAAVEFIQAGRIVCIKGIGGYQLICDATNDTAVQRLREGKRRRRKPLAVMVATPEEICQSCTPGELAELRSACGPIVLISKPSAAECTEDSDRHRLAKLSRYISPGLSTVGVMLPTSPLHLLLAHSAQQPLVVTSGNIEGEPMVTTATEAEDQLTGLVDLFLHHNRDIVSAIDDSVVRLIHESPVTIRCGRGIAPLPIDIRTNAKILAVGGHQKVAIALSNGHQAVLGPHIGEMSSAATRGRFTTQAESLQRLYGGMAELLVHDLHPDYFTSQWAMQQSLPTLAVQHHHAHIASTMVEHNLLGQKVLGIAFDGSGFGPDGTIWGGEVLIVSSVNYRRIARLAPFALPGGEAAIHEPWRMTVSLLAESRDQVPANDMLARWGDAQIDRQRIDAVAQLCSASFTQRTSSCGRLFDAVAALVLNQTAASYEGELAAALEAVCDTSETESYTMPAIEDRGILNLRWDRLFLEIIKDLAKRTDPGTIAMRFHSALANAITAVAAKYPNLPVVLSGGCFQNRILTELVVEQLLDHPAGCYHSCRIPPNDGGLAVGQLAVAAAVIEAGKRSREEESCV